MTGRTVLCAVLTGLLMSPAAVDAQGIRGKARTYLSYIQFREFVLDSVPASSVPGPGRTRRLLPDGTRTYCVGGVCEFWRTGGSVGVAPLIQDLELSAWPGVVGLRARAHLRMRQSLGDGALWPRADKELEALTAFLEYSRPRIRLRGGRLWRTSALGFHNYDGLEVVARLPGGLRVEAYGGWSVVEALNERHTGELLEAVEPFSPTEDAWVLGAGARWRPTGPLSTSILYQRQIRTDRAGLYSERIAGAARVVAGSSTVDVEVEHDLATGETNDARLRVGFPVAGGVRASVEGRHYQPFFELWTIWGAFSPVGFNEARLWADWTRDGGGASVHLAAGYRSYEETDAEGAGVVDLRDAGWRLEAGGQVEAIPAWRIQARYQAEVGYGSALSGVDVALRHDLDRESYLALRATGFNRISEFRVGEGIVVGAGADGAASYRSARLRGGLMIYRHYFDGRPSFRDWNQLRGSLSVEIPLGRDPGLAGREGR